MDKSGSEGSVPITDAVYHEVSPQKVLATKMYIGLTAFMILLALIFCLVQGRLDYTYFLMGINILISAMIIVFSCYWWKSGDLDPSKWWFLILVGTVIIFQCITTDIYVFQHENPSANATTTAAPVVTTHHSGGPVTIKPATTVKAVLDALGGGSLPN